MVRVQVESRSTRLRDFTGILQRAFKGPGFFRVIRSPGFEQRVYLQDRESYDRSDRSFGFCGFTSGVLLKTLLYNLIVICNYLQFKAATTANSSGVEIVTFIKRKLDNKLVFTVFFFFN